MVCSLLLSYLPSSPPNPHAESTHLFSENRSPLALICQTRRRSPSFLFKPVLLPCLFDLFSFLLLPLAAFPLRASRTARDESVTIQKGTRRSEVPQRHFRHGPPLMKDQSVICGVCTGGIRTSPAPLIGRYPIYTHQRGTSWPRTRRIATLGESQIT